MIPCRPFYFYHASRPAKDRRKKGEPALGEEDKQDAVSLTITEDPSSDKKGRADDVVSDIDDIDTEGKDEPDKTDADKETKEDKTDDKDKASADKGEKKVEDVATLQARLDRLEEDKKNLKIALHKERQEKKTKTATAQDEVVLSDDQLKKILEENPDPETQIRVARYVAQEEAKRRSGQAIDAVQVASQKKAANDFLLARWPTLSDDTSDMRMDVESTKERFGLKDHPLGDLFAVGVRIAESLPEIQKTAYEKGKADALAEKADKSRQDKIKDADLTPGSKGKKGQGGIELTKTQIETKKQMNLSPKAQAVYDKLVGGKAKTVSIE